MNNIELIFIVQGTVYCIYNTSIYINTNLHCITEYIICSQDFLTFHYDAKKPCAIEKDTSITEYYSRNNFLIMFLTMKSVIARVWPRLGHKQKCRGHYKKISPTNTNRSLQIS